MSQQKTAIIVGAGHRGVLYGSYALQHPDEFKIVGVSDPNEFRRQQTAEKFGFGPDMCFESAEELASKGQLADAIINGTMDTEHVATSVPLLEQGYHMLLEKPIATYEHEVRQLLEVARKHDRIVMICHVLRYAPFYSTIRQKIIDGEIGEIVSIVTEENVSYHHMGSCFVRGKWNRGDDGITMLMAKCCHDLDLITWMKSGVAPVRVASFGSLMQFKPENAPEGSGTRCLVDCKRERECEYSCKRNFIEQNIWGFYAWQSIEQDLSIENKIRSLKEENPYGRCVWRCDNDVVDHQTVIVEFADSSTATHNMAGGTSKPSRTMHLIGTRGEIEGVDSDGYFVIRHPDTSKGSGSEWSEERVEMDVSGGHGGGDLRLVADFVYTLQGKPRSISCTSLEDSIYGHLIGFAADRARVEHKSLEVAI